MSKFEKTIIYGYLLIIFLSVSLVFGIYLTNKYYKQDKETIADITNVIDSELEESIANSIKYDINANTIVYTIEEYKTNGSISDGLIYYIFNVIDYDTNIAYKYSVICVCNQVIKFNRVVEEYKQYIHFINLNLQDYKVFDEEDTISYYAKIENPEWINITLTITIKEGYTLADDFVLFYNGKVISNYTLQGNTITYVYKDSYWSKSY